MKNEGTSLIEILVVIMAFSILGVLVARSVFLTVQGTRKSEGTTRVRENINYAMDVMSRQIKNANSVSATSCDGTTSVAVINYTDASGQAGSFACTVSGADVYIASGSARLTSTDVVVTNPNCKIFVCTAATSTTPAGVAISITAFDTATSDIENAQVSSTAKVYLRTY